MSNIGVQTIHSLRCGDVLNLYGYKKDFLIVQINWNDEKEIKSIDVIDENESEYRLHVVNNINEQYLKMTEKKTQSDEFERIDDFNMSHRDLDWLFDYSDDDKDLLEFWCEEESLAAPASDD